MLSPVNIARIEELEEALSEAKRALKTASDVQYAQAEELKRLRPLGAAITELWWFWSRLSAEHTTTIKAEAPDGAGQDWR